MASRQAKSVPKAPYQPRDTTLQLARIDGLFTTARMAIRWIGIVVLVYAAGYALKPFAGQSTFVSVFFSFLADIKFVMAVTLAGTAVAWAVVERLLRQRKTAQLEGRIKQLETHIDPNRTSSGLTTKGKTNPKDKTR